MWGGGGVMVVEGGCGFGRSARVGWGAGRVHMHTKWGLYKCTVVQLGVVQRDMGVASDHFSIMGHPTRNMRGIPCL